MWIQQFCCHTNKVMLYCYVYTLRVGDVWHRQACCSRTRIAPAADVTAAPGSIVDGFMGLQRNVRASVTYSPYPYTLESFLWFTNGRSSTDHLLLQHSQRHQLRQHSNGAQGDEHVYTVRARTWLSRQHLMLPTHDRGAINPLVQLPWFVQGILQDVKVYRRSEQDCRRAIAKYTEGVRM